MQNREVFNVYQEGWWEFPKGGQNSQKAGLKITSRKAIFYNTQLINE
jgi:hypothetical protein